MRITDALRVEHRLLRVLPEAMSGWFVAGTPPETLRPLSGICDERGQ